MPPPLFERPAPFAAPPPPAPSIWNRNIGCGGGLLILVGIVVVANLMNGPSNKGGGGLSSPPREEAPPPIPPPDPVPALKLTIVEWELGGFDTVFIGTFRVENRSDKPIKDIEIRCATQGASGTALSSVTKTIFETVPAKGKKTFSKVSMGFVDPQSSRAGCAVVGARF